MTKVYRLDIMTYTVLDNLLFPILFLTLDATHTVPKRHGVGMRNKMRWLCPRERCKQCCTTLLFQCVAIVPNVSRDVWIMLISKNWASE